MPSIGPLELLVILIIALVVFGPKRLPELGASLGRGIREFRSSVSGAVEDRDGDGSSPARPELKGSESGPESSAEPVDGEIVGENHR